jgi:hypothetical protein
MASLFALGQDAWNLLPWLELMRKDPDFVFPGQSGNYRMDRNGGLQRAPAWAVFSGGLPVALPAPAEAVPAPAAPSPPAPSPPGAAESAGALR